MNRKSFKIVEVFEGAQYDKFYPGNDLEESIIVLEGDTFAPLEEYSANVDEILEDDAEMQEIEVGFDEDILSKHILILGGIGMGKTNTFLSFTNQILCAEEDDDVVLIFDTKGDYYKTFGDKYASGDIFISNVAMEDKNGQIKKSTKEEIWNIFNELDDDKLEETSNEIASMIFAKAMKETSQPFFPNAAKSIFAALLRAMKRNEPIFDQPLSNKLLKNFFNGKNIGLMGIEEGDVLGAIGRLLSGEERGALSYLTVNNEVANNGQTQGIIAELRLVIDQLFIGNFAEEGTFSIKKTIRERSGKRIFLEYDIAEGNTLSPIYSLLVDLAIKEALETNLQKEEQERGNTYFIVDEFKLLPHLRHLDDAVNFGRSIGVKFIIGLQNISQVIENYGQDNAMNILSGFSTVIAYRVTDYATRKYLIELFGENRKRTTYLSAIASRGVVESLEKANVVEDWDILSLKVGECIVRLAQGKEEVANKNPFFLKTKLFE